MAEARVVKFCTRVDFINLHTISYLANQTPLSAC